MKMIIFLIALIIPLKAGIMFTDYQSTPEKKETAQPRGQDVRQDLTAAQKNTYKVSRKEATAEEWKKFNKNDFEQKIKTNEMRITELNIKIRKSAELFYPFYVKKIVNLEKENRFLKGRLEAYEKHLSTIGSI